MSNKKEITKNYKKYKMAVYVIIIINIIIMNIVIIPLKSKLPLRGEES
jgi:hypothetical protein